MLRLYNTMGRHMQDFVPLTPGKAGFYGCGPTVYTYAHIGNLRAYVTHDILTRTLKRMGYEVTHVMNITDVGHLSDDADDGDDKMVKTAEERGKTVMEIADLYTRAFFTDMERLNIEKPSIVCKATEHVQDMIGLIKRIEANGFTYSSGGNLYFDISKFPHYGDLAMLRMDELKAGARIAADSNKRNPADFVLWFTKSKFENQALVWDSPWGRGYPGWHIECSAMSMKYLGEQFDIHAGGIDHIPIHHTNEIAQSEAATGKHPWVNYWLHNEFLIMEKGKMSKSAGGFITLQDVIDRGFDPLDYRYFLLGGHYRSQLQFSWTAMEGARNARRSLLEKIGAFAEKVTDTSEKNTEKVTDTINGTKNYLEAFNRALEDDLSTPRALAELWGLLKENARLLSEPAVQKTKIYEVIAAVIDMDRVLGLNLGQAVIKNEKREDPSLALEMETLIKERAEAKKAKNFAKADEIRNLLKERGIVLTDSPAGTTWKRQV